MMVLSFAVKANDIENFYSSKLNSKDPLSSGITWSKFSLINLSILVLSRRTMRLMSDLLSEFEMWQSQNCAFHVKV